MREPQDTEIGGHVYRVSMLNTTRGWKLLLRVAKMVGPSIGIVVDGVGLSQTAAADEGFLQKLADKKLGDQFFAQAISKLTDSIYERDMEHVIKELAQATRVRWNRNGELSDFMPLAGENFEVHFQGETGRMLQWLAFALKSQFSDFSSALGSAVMSQGGDPETAARQ